MSFNDYSRSQIQELLGYLDMRIEQAEREEKRFYEAGQLSSAYMWTGTLAGFRDAKVAVHQILLNEDVEEKK